MRDLQRTPTVRLRMSPKQTRPRFPHCLGSDVLVRHARHTGCMTPTSAVIVDPRTPGCWYDHRGKRSAIVNDDGCANLFVEEYLDGGIPTWKSGVLHVFILCAAVSFRRHSFSLFFATATSFPSQRIQLNREPDFWTHIRARLVNRYPVSE